MSNPDDNYIGVLLEEIRDQNKAVLEAAGDMQKQVARMPCLEEAIKELRDDVTATKAAVRDLSRELATLKSDVTDLKDDMKVVKAAVTDQDKQFQDHEQRVTRLETKPV